MFPKHIQQRCASLNGGRNLLTSQNEDERNQTICKPNTKTCSNKENILVQEVCSFYASDITIMLMYIFLWDTSINFLNLTKQHLGITIK